MAVPANRKIKGAATVRNTAAALHKTGKGVFINTVHATECIGITSAPALSLSK